MKSIVIISLIALSGVGIGLFQHSRLVAARQESAELTREISPASAPARLATHSRSRTVDSQPTAEISPHESVTSLAAQMVGMVEKANARFARVKNGEKMTAEEQAVGKEFQDQLRKGFAALDPAEVLELIHQLEANPNLPESLRTSPARACVEILMRENPKVLLDVIPSLKDYPKPEPAMREAFDLWVRKSPAEAVKWFDDEGRKENPLTRSGGMLGSVVCEEARLDPAHALSRVLSQDAVDGPENFVNLGANIAVSLDELDENLAFFSALRQQMEKSPDTSVLAKIRSDYLNELGKSLVEWPFESVVTMLDNGCTPAEKAAVAKNLYRGDLDEPDKWATWIIGLSPPATGEHPLKSFMGGWFQVDPNAARKWLEQAPEVELKYQLLEKYEK